MAGAGYRGLARIVSLLGYGLLLAVPAGRTAVSPAFGTVVEVAVVLSAALMAIRLILRNRIPVRMALRALAEQGIGVRRCWSCWRSSGT